MKRALKWLLSAGFLLIAVGAGALMWAGRHYDVSTRFLVARALGTLDLPIPGVAAVLQPPPRYVDRPMDGTIRAVHPRILLPELAGWDGVPPVPVMADRMARFAARGKILRHYPPCGHARPLSHAVCWLATGEEGEAQLGIEGLMRRRLSRPALKNSGSDTGSATDTWEWALAFDLLSIYPGWNANDREMIAGKLRRSLEAHLHVLDDESASLWHGRSSLAAQAWLLAVVVAGDTKEDADLLRRAQAHFLETMRALALTEAWPEGYNYWINNRALVIALAVGAWVNGLEGSELAPSILQTLRRAGLWTVYATRPDNRIEGLGDEGPRVDLKDETRRVIDLMAQLTRDRALATYSGYLERLHGRESYYSAYRWSYALFNDPTVQPLPGVNMGDLAGLEAYLPTTEVFGPGAFNLFIIRSGWGRDATFVSMRAGDTFTHHGHYDAGHFTLFKGAPLAVDSSRYNAFYSPNRLYYSLRTIAKNSVVVVRPGDVIRPNPRFSRNVNGGGQRIVMPTGSRILSTDHWREKLGQGDHLEGAQTLDHAAEPGRYTYIRSDLTGAYDSIRYDSQGRGGKVSSVIRELLYLYGEDRLIVRDRVRSTDPAFAAKWLLHTVNKPVVDDTSVLVGSAEAGIFESAGDRITVTNGRGRLDVKPIQPAPEVVRILGGAGYEFYVESDAPGDRYAVAGENFREGGRPRPWFDNARWRLEIRPRQQQAADSEFMVVLSPGLDGGRNGEVEALRSVSGGVIGALTPDRLVIFVSGAAAPGEFRFALPGEQRSLMLPGVTVGDRFRVGFGDGLMDYKIEASGVFEIALPQGLAPGDVVRLDFVR